MNELAEHAVGEVYAKALMDLAGEKNLREQVMADLELVFDVCDKDEDFAAFLSLPFVPPYERAEVVRKVFANRLTVLSMDFLGVLIKNGRSRYLGSVCSTYRRLLDESNGISQVEVTVADEMDEQAREKLRQDISASMGCGVRLNVLVDRRILGGIIIRHGGMKIDNSVRRGLVEAVSMLKLGPEN
jgi:F-type H+-transporting ATPase subunit delta